MMKKISYIFTVIVLCGSLSCTEDMKYNDAAVQAPAGLLSPKNNYFLELQSGSGTSINFSWLPGACEDGYPVQYEIIFFDQASGGKELGRIDAGVQTQVVVSHKDVNRIAGEAGIAPGEAGSMYWSVAASRGLNQELSAVTPYKLDVKRLLGFNFIPERLYLIGSGTEGGTDPAGALSFRTTGDGEYEIYTQFTDGTFMIVDNPTSPAHSYGIQGSLATEITAAINVPGIGVYRIRLDFNVKSASVQAVTSVNHWLCHKSQLTPMEYVGGGTWMLKDMFVDPTIIGDYTGAIDDRYHFRAYITGNAWPWECLGPINAGEDGRPASLDAKEYFYLATYPSTSADQWGPKFKFSNLTFGNTVDLYVEMGANPPTHRFVLK
jgi:hypothetical protein